MYDYLKYLSFPDLYKSPPPKLFAIGDSDNNENLFIPAGSDSQNLIESTSSCISAEGLKTGTDPNGRLLLLNDLPIESVFPPIKLKALDRDSELVVDDKISFLKQMKSSLDNDARSIPTNIKASAPTGNAERKAAARDLNPNSLRTPEQAPVSVSSTPSSQTEPRKVANATGSSVAKTQTQAAAVKDFFQSLLSQPSKLTSPTNVKRKSLTPQTQDDSK